jgi:hypothetical protein
VRVAGGDGTLAALGFLVQVIALDVGDELVEGLEI